MNQIHQLIDSLDVQHRFTTMKGDRLQIFRMVLRDLHEVDDVVE